MSKSNPMHHSTAGLMMATARHFRDALDCKRQGATYPAQALAEGRAIVRDLVASLVASGLTPAQARGTLEQLAEEASKGLV